MKQANLATKPDIADFVKETDFNNKLKKLNKKITSNKTKHSLELNELSKDNINKNISKKFDKYISVY